MRRFAVVTLMLLIAAGPSFAKTHKDMYSMQCSALWPAVKDALRNSGKYGILGIDNTEMTASFVIGGTLSGKRINSVVLNAKGDTCEMQVQTAYSGLVHNDEGDFKKRVDESLAKQQGRHRRSRLRLQSRRVTRNNVLVSHRALVRDDPIPSGLGESKDLEMLLPFVRELFAEVEQLPAFTRAASHLRESTGRISVTGLSAAAKALIVVLLRRAVERPLVLVVADNRAAEDLLPVLRAFCELTGAADPDSVVSLPARDVLPFQNLSPHPEIQEERATALWKIATGRAAFVISPVTATTILLRSPDYYADLARVLRRGEIFDLEKLLEHLNTVGYSATDVVEMPGQYAARGGILDVYSPEADRPVRVEFFGDEIESMRKFDPASQRSSNPVDEALLLPLTETPVTEDLLGSINARLSGKRITGSPEIVEQAVRDSGAGIFPGWEFYAPVAGADRSIFGLLPEARVILDEPEALKLELDKVWARIEEAHERSGVGNLVRPADLYLTPETWRETTAALPGADFEYLAVARKAPEDHEANEAPQPTKKDRKPLFFRSPPRASTAPCPP